MGWRLLRNAEDIMAQTIRTHTGTETLVQRARPATIALVLAKHAVLAALLFGPPLVWALFEGAWMFSTALAAPVILGGVASAIVWRKGLPRDLRGVEAMVSIALLFLLAAALSVPAFMTLGMPTAAALFEGMSAITTTGLSMARTPDDWPFAAHVLRSWMQWCGGLAMATAVLALVIGPGPAAKAIGKAGIDGRDRIRSTRAQARELLEAYAALTLLFVVLISLAIGDLGEGLVLSLSAISTGGFAPRSDSLASYTLIGQVAVILASIAGAISLLAFAHLLTRDGPPIWAHPSVRRVGAAVVICAVVLACVLLIVPQPPAYLPTLLNLLSGITTAGFSVSAIPLATPLIVIFVIAMIVGGDRGSTAGGLKMLRLSTMLAAARHVITLPRLPERAVAPFKHRGEKVSPDYLLMTLAVLGLYAATALFVWVWLLAQGYPPLSALFDTVSTLSTVGLSAGVVNPDMTVGTQLVLTLAMWLGRLEFIAVIVLLLPGTWIKTRPPKGV
ncbi:MAG: potassium transporter TrkG [Pseudomonadota bacterium]